MPKATKISLSHRALLARINRKLAHEGEKVVAKRGAYDASIGAYYLVDVGRNAIAATHVEPEKFARELGVLAAWECLKVAS